MIIALGAPEFVAQPQGSALAPARIELLDDEFGVGSDDDEYGDEGFEGDDDYLATVGLEIE